MTEHKTHIGHSLENDTWFVRVYGFETEADAAAYQASIASPAPHVVGYDDVYRTLNEWFRERRIYEDVTPIARKITALIKQENEGRL